MSDMNTKDFLIGSLIGGIVGASAALLLAPKSGKELRDNISEQAQVARDKTTQITTNAYDKGNEWASIAKEKSTLIAKAVSDQSSQIVEKVKEVTAKSKAEAEAEAENNKEEAITVMEDVVEEVTNTGNEEVASSEELVEEIVK
ncbi:YtxH domain-containing protein [bacterium LRH843]|nr:YtxH domain-containing protein [bacterium LRH843]